jgi:hypothetical protein
MASRVDTRVRDRVRVLGRPPVAMRMPRPFYRKQKTVWAVQLRDGRQITLGKTREEAEKKYREVMLHENLSGQELQVWEVFDLYLEYCRRETSYYELYRYSPSDASKVFGKNAVSQLTSFHTGS